MIMKFYDKIIFMIKKIEIFYHKNDLIMINFYDKINFKCLF